MVCGIVTACGREETSEKTLQCAVQIDERASERAVSGRQDQTHGEGELANELSIAADPTFSGPP